MKIQKHSLFLLLILALALLCLPGCSTTRDVENTKESPSTSGIDSAKMAQLLNNVTISEQAFSTSGNYVEYTIILANHNSSYWASQLSVNIIGKAADGSTQFEKKESHYSLFANGRAIISGLEQVDTEVASIEVWPIEKDWVWEQGNISDDWKAENITASVDWVEAEEDNFGECWYTIYGTINNRSTYYVGNRDIYILFRDKSESLLAESDLSIDDGGFCLYPGDSHSFEIEGRFPYGENQNTANYELVVDDITFLPDNFDDEPAVS